jgi:hypothetical protein
MQPEVVALQIYIGQRRRFDSTHEIRHPYRRRVETHTKGPEILEATKYIAERDGLLRALSSMVSKMVSAIMETYFEFLDGCSYEFIRDFAEQRDGGGNVSV